MPPARQGRTPVAYGGKPAYSAGSQRHQDTKKTYCLGLHFERARAILGCVAKMGTANDQVRTCVFALIFMIKSNFFKWRHYQP